MDKVRMKRYRNVYYIVTHPNKWWCGKQHGWTADPIGTKAKRIRYIFTAKKAFRSVPKGGRLFKIFYRRGVKYESEYVIASKETGLGKTK